MNIHLGALYLLAAPVAAVNMQATNFMSSGRRLDDSDHDHDDECHDETELIFSDEADPDVYENWDELVDENTGEFTGNMEDLSDFTARCKSMNGRVAQVSVEFNGEECGPGFSSVPICVGKSCSDEGAEAGVLYFFEDEDGDCDIVSIEFEDDDYPNDDDGDDDFDFDKIFAAYENLSPLCQLNSFDFFFYESLNQLFPIPEQIENENGVVQLDFGANKDEFDAYVDQCAVLGGQPIAIQMNSDRTSEDSADILNYPYCFGAACDEEDRRMFATQWAELFFNGILTTEVESLGGENVPQVDKCRDETLRTHLPPSVLYDNFDGIIVDGEFTGDEEALSDFTALCESMSGRVAPISVKFEDSEDEVCTDVSSVPVCVGKSCSNEGAEAAWGLISQSSNFFGECDIVSIKIESPSTSKSTKKSKGTKAPKSAKGDKATKAPKTAKGDKATKAPKTAKGDKSP